MSPRIIFEQELEQLKEKVSEMAEQAEIGYDKLSIAIKKNDREVLTQLLSSDRQSKEMLRSIEAQCLALMTKQQPVARDLRVISSALKMITDMERIGDQAADISEVTLHLIDAKYKRDMEHIRKMAAETTCMVVQSVEAYVEKDEEKAKEVIAHDDIIDDLFIKSREDVISLIRSNPEEGACATDLLMIAKYFERIGDHACNIAEWVIFSITGEHKKK